MNELKPMRELTRIREERGLSQQGLADASGVNKATINQIERGRRSPNARTLEKLAGALSVEIADLFPKAQSPLPLEDLSPAQWANRAAVRGEIPQPTIEDTDDIVTLRLYVWRELEKDDPLVQKVAKLVKDERLASPDTITISTQELYEMMRRVWNHEREPDAALMELGAE
jgi:transcriptional regulator with XRE-family HTH domain